MRVIDRSSTCLYTPLKVIKVKYRNILFPEYERNVKNCKKIVISQYPGVLHIANVVNASEVKQSQVFRLLRRLRLLAMTIGY